MEEVLRALQVFQPRRLAWLLLRVLRRCRSPEIEIRKWVISARAAEGYTGNPRSDHGQYTRACPASGTPSKERPHSESASADQRAPQALIRHGTYRQPVYVVGKCVLTERGCGGGDLLGRNFKPGAFSCFSARVGDEALIDSSHVLLRLRRDGKRPRGAFRGVN